MNAKYSIENFLNKLNDNNLNVADCNIYSDQWPLLKLKLEKEQINTISYKINDIDTIIKKCEMQANNIHDNSGIINTTTLKLNKDELIIKGSLTVIELILKEIFGYI